MRDYSRSANKQLRRVVSIRTSRSNEILIGNEAQAAEIVAEAEQANLRRQ